MTASKNLQEMTFLSNLFYQAFQMNWPEPGLHLAFGNILSGHTPRRLASLAYFHRFDADHSRLKLDKLSQSKVAGIIVQVTLHLRVVQVRIAFGLKWKVRIGHNFFGKVGS